MASRLVWELVDIAGRKAYHVRLGRLEGTPTNRFGYNDIYPSVIPLRKVFLIAENVDKIIMPLPI